VRGSSRRRLHILKARCCGAVMLCVNLEAEIPAAELLGGYQRLAGTGKRIKHDIIRRAEG